MKKHNRFFDWIEWLKMWASRTTNVAPWALAFLLGGVLWAQSSAREPKMVHRSSAGFAVGDFPQQVNCPPAAKVAAKKLKRR